MLKMSFDSSIISLKQTYINQQLNLPSEIYTFIQLNNGKLLVGLGNGTIFFFNKENILEPSFILNADEYPITNIIQTKNNSIICSSNNPSIFIIKENQQNKKEYEILKKINIKPQRKQINKIIEINNGNIISVDNSFITLWSNQIDLIKEKKLDSPITDVIALKKKIIASALPVKKSIIYFETETEKLEMLHEIKNLKFIQSMDISNILTILNGDFLFVGGCLGCVYLINLKNRDFVANINLVNNREIITSVYNLANGDLLCGASVIENDDNEIIKVDSDLIQFEYKEYRNSFKEIDRKKYMHSNIIRNIKEIIDYKGMKQLVSASLDGTILIFKHK